MNASNSSSLPTWYAATRVPAPERPPLTQNLDVDVCVVGGGLAGLTVAYETARRGWSVAVLEAQQLAWSASGRNGGLVLPGFAENPEAIVDRVGRDRAKALWRLSLAGVEYVRDAIAETGMPGVSPTGGWLYVQRAESMDRAHRAAALVRDLGGEVEVWDVEQVRDVLATDRYFQALHFPRAFHIHPLNYALGLAAAAERAGARIFERTRALAIDPAGVRKHVQTTGARLRAHHVVLAGSAHLAPLYPLVSDAVLSVVTYIAVTAPLGEELREAIDYSGAVVDTRGVPGYFRIVGGDRLMWGGRVGGRNVTPQRIVRKMGRHIREVFPQLRGVEITHAWSGTMAYAMHRMPLVGEISPGLWVTTAFGGHGLNTTAMAGDLIARAIDGDDDTWRLFASYDLVWAGGRFGVAARQAAYWFLQARDWIDETVTRRRYAARMRRERIAASVADEAKRRVATEAARVAAERAAWRHAEAARLIREEEERQAAADAARLAAEQAEREAVKASRMAGAEAARLAAVQEAELAAIRAEQRVAEELRAAAAETGRPAAEVAPELVAEEAARAAEVARLAEREVERQAGADFAQQAAEEAEHIAADAARTAAHEDERLAAAHEARVVAQDAEQQAVQEQASAQAAVEKVEQEVERKRKRKPGPRKRRPSSVAPETSSLTDLVAPGAAAPAELSAAKPARKRKPRTAEQPASQATAILEKTEAEAPAQIPEPPAKPKRRRSKSA
jgi:gamma-glutamylputrescine oxidase